MAQISLTIQSVNYKTVISRTQGFESDLMESLIANPEIANTVNPLAGASQFVFKGDVYTVSESVATITSLSGGGGATSETGTPVSNVSTVVEQGIAGFHQTVITVDAACPIVSVGAAVAEGGLKIYDFPEGRILIHGVTASFNLLVESADEADFTDGTPEGDWAIGTAITTSNTLGDATDVDLLPKTAFTMTDYTVDTTGALAVSAQFDGTTTAKDANINIIVDAADIDDDVTTAITVSGTVTITWSNLGDL